MTIPARSSSPPKLASGGRGDDGDAGDDPLQVCSPLSSAELLPPTVNRRSPTIRGGRSSVAGARCDALSDDADDTDGISRLFSRHLLATPGACADGSPPSCGRYGSSASPGDRPPSSAMSQVFPQLETRGGRSGRSGRSSADLFFSVLIRVNLSEACVSHSVVADDRLTMARKDRQPEKRLLERLLTMLTMRCAPVPLPLLLSPTSSAPWHHVDRKTALW